MKFMFGFTDKYEPGETGVECEIQKYVVGFEPNFFIFPYLKVLSTVMCKNWANFLASFP